jgi:nucleotide-binding universal stress UspA family protein
MTSIPQRILAATDFSETANHAQRAAVSLARAFDAELHFLHVQVLLDDPHLEESYHTEIQQLLESAKSHKIEAMEKPGEHEQLEIHTHLVRGLAAAEVICETCKDLGCDLIVMGTHGRRGIRHLFLGSVTERVLRSAPSPVLTIRHDARLPSEGVSRILVPHDFSDESRGALEYAAAWARAFEAELTLFHVVEPVVYPEFYSVDVLPNEVQNRIEKRSIEALDAAAHELLPGIQSFTEVAVGRPADRIVAAASPDRFDLAIMGTRGLSAVEHLLMGSVAENVLRRCQLPLLAVRS